MQRILVLCIFALALPAACFAQANQTESLTVTTYYPAPFGVYKNMRLIERPEPLPGDKVARQAGTIFFNESDQKLYVYNDNTTKWEKIGSGGSGGSGSGLKIYVGHSFSPEAHCSHYRLPAGDPYYDELCSWSWYEEIKFPQPFNKTPHVIVVTERNPGSHSPCASNMSDHLVAYPDEIKPDGFTVYAAGSPAVLSTCGGTGVREGYRTYAEVGWLAIGE